MIGCSPFKMTGMFFLQKRVEDLREQRKTVENQIATAEDSLQKTVDLIKELSDSKMVSFITLYPLFPSTSLITCNSQLLNRPLAVKMAYCCCLMSLNSDCFFLA